MSAIVTRVILSLDDQGYVAKAEWEPAGHEHARAVCVIQVNNLIAKANALLHEIDLTDSPPEAGANAERRHGARIAMERLRVSDEASRLRDALADLRPYLEVMSRAKAEDMARPATTGVPKLNKPAGPPPHIAEAFDAGLLFPTVSFPDGGGGAAAAAESPRKRRHA